VPISFFKHPCSSQYRRRAIAIRSAQQHSAFTKQSETLLVGQCDLAELRAGHARNSVVSSQTFIQEGGVAGQKFDNASIIREDAADERFRFRREIMSQFVFERGKQLGSGPLDRAS
jgi:hypothetical protein